MNQKIVYLWSINKKSKKMNEEIEYDYLPGFIEQFGDGPLG